MTTLSVLFSSNVIAHNHQSSVSIVWFQSVGSISLILLFTPAARDMNVCIGVVTWVVKNSTGLITNCYLLFLCCYGSQFYCFVIEFVIFSIPLKTLACRSEASITHDRSQTSKIVPCVNKTVKMEKQAVERKESYLHPFMRQCNSSQSVKEFTQH